MSKHHLGESVWNHDISTMHLQIPEKNPIISGLFPNYISTILGCVFFLETFSTSPETWFVHLFLAFFDCISMKTRQFWENKNTIEPTGSIGSMVCLPTNWPSTINQMYQNMPWILGLPYFGGWICVFFFRRDKMLAYNKYILSFHGPPNTPNDDRGAAH